MDAILIAVIPVAIIGIICAVMLVVASKVMAVKENEKFPAVRDCLPGANCGACGFAGCDGYAKALAENENTPTNLCVPGGAACARELSEVLGVEFEDVAAQVAVVHCLGDCNVTEDRVDYRGMESCAAAKMIFGGKGKCGYGCLGLGDCARACPQEAICIQDGIARVYTPDCIGCAICVKTCPNHLISLHNADKVTVVTCSNKDKGALTRKACSNGCIGCKKCEKTCEFDAIKVLNNLAVIDYSKCTSCGACAEVCMTKCIKIYNFK
ncbi:MAG: RnfABCDGE type electron transport complex subunit B [Ruminococcus sp.]|nr:RnfABCDGE type electron transport complex subunit B [Ruminococcus sp.]